MKFSNFNDYHSDIQRESDGVPLDLGQGRALIVRRSGSRNREFIAAIADIEPSDSVAQIDVVAGTLIVGWQGVKDDAGNDIPFSVEACKELFTFAPDLLDMVAVFATKRANFANAELLQEKEDAKKA